ncbi:MAG: DoxX family protein [Flavobacteriales bacterium]|nr:DoxX family protein [Flavobacteriales bacterium]
MNDRSVASIGERIGVTVWISQFFLFVAFGISGTMKLAMDIEELTRIMVWPGQVPEWLVRLTGVCELSGAIGIVGPALTGIKPWLTRWAAFGLSTLMGCALGYHLMLFQGLMLVPSLVLLVISAYVGVRRM